LPGKLRGERCLLAGCRAGGAAGAEGDAGRSTVGDGGAVLRGGHASFSDIHRHHQVRRLDGKRWDEKVNLRPRGSLGLPNHISGLEAQ
jgi:hypothetical protein